MPPPSGRHPGARKATMLATLPTPMVTGDQAPVSALTGDGVPATAHPAPVKAMSTVAFRLPFPIPSRPPLRRPARWQGMSGDSVGASERPVEGPGQRVVDVRCVVIERRRPAMYVLADRVGVGAS